MLIKEYRIPMPMSVEEYRIAQLYMIQVRSQQHFTKVSPTHTHKHTLLEKKQDKSKQRRRCINGGYFVIAIAVSPIMK